MTWTQNERSDLKIKDHYSPQCAQGIWDTGIDPRLKATLPEILKKQRVNTCFFVEAQDGMSFEAARQLHKTRNENRNLKRNYIYTQIGLWIAAISLLMNLLYSVFKDFVLK